MIKTGEFIIYQAPDGTTDLDVRLEDDTVWLTQNQIAELFGTKRPAITKHLRNIFSSGELSESSVSSILEHTASDGKTYQTKFYNLDAILSVGYRVNSKNATQFRIWANKVLKEYSQEAIDYMCEPYKDPGEHRKYVFGEITHVWIKKA